MSLIERIVKKLNNLYKNEKNELKTRLINDKIIHIVSITFISLIQLKNQKAFKKLFANNT